MLLSIPILGVFILVELDSLCLADYAASINIDTFKLQPIVRPAITHHYSIFDQITLENNGRGIDGYLSPTCKRSFIFGGPLCPGTIYIAYNIRVNFNASIVGVSGLTFNHVGTPVTVNSFWYNAKYGTPEKASSFPDGVVVVREPVRIGAPNPFFPAFQEVLKQIQARGTRFTTLNSIASGWFNPTANVRDYYTYIGVYASAINETPVKLHTATVIVLPLEYTTTISPAQELCEKGQSSIKSFTQSFKQPDVPVYCVNGPVIYNFSV